MELTGKLIIITGVSKGIGLATAETLLQKGAVIAGWGRNAPDLNHPNFYFFETDVQQFASVEKAYKNMVQQLGSEVFGLINNAGLGISGKLEEMALEDWDTMFRTNVNGVFYCCKVVLPDMKQNETGHIVNISSIAGLNGVEEMAGYCGTKYAVRGISQSLFKEVRNFGIKVSCIYPGSVQTNFFDDIPGVTANENMMQPDDIAATIVHVLESPPNYLHVDIEVRPLMPKGKPKR